MKKLDKLGKGIILMHDFHKHTAEALPELLRKLKAGGYKVVAMRAKDPVQTLAQYDDAVAQGRQTSDRQLPSCLQRGADDLGIDSRPRAMPDLRIEGYVIVSADGMLANADRVMPDELKFEGDKQFFAAALDHADLIVHGRHSYEDQPNSPRRKRIILTRKRRRGRARSVQSQSHTVESGGCFVRGGLRSRRRAAGTVAIIGGPDVFGMFMDRYDTFWLSQAPHVRLPGRRALLPRRARAFTAANPRPRTA